MNDTPSSTASAATTVSAGDHLAWLRTRFAIERTLMAWVRTATALIAFGFSMVSFFDQFATMEHVSQARLPVGPRILGLGLIALGTLGVAASLVQFRTFVLYLREEPFAGIAGARRAPSQLPLVAVAVAVVLVGLAAFVAVLARGV